MKSLNLLMCAWLVLQAACAPVISREIRDEALPALPLGTLLANVDDYRGRTAILGGYILKVDNGSDTARLWLLQTPLDAWESPTGKDNSEGRLLVDHPGFLDPEIYRPNRRLTVAGVIEGVNRDGEGTCPAACLEVTSRQLYLWEESPPPDYFIEEHYFYTAPYYGYGGYWYPFSHSYPYPGPHYRYPHRSPGRGW